MQTQHYALSEGLIVMAALWSAYRLGRRAMWAGMAGVLLFGLAALIGALRFGLGQVDEWQQLHQAVSQIGGVMAMALLALQLVSMTGRAKFLNRAILVAFALITGLAAAAWRESSTLSFLAWLVLAILAALALPERSKAERLGTAAVVAIFLVNLIFVRQSPALGAALSWHMFHALVAVWIVGVTVLLARAEGQHQEP